ncbi:MAG: UDP-3-O-(3-hydroxymyristoyl)glucosamine N-acyltransferase [Gemmatimonadaceae bacterium]
MARAAPSLAGTKSSFIGDGVRATTAEAVSELVSGELRGDGSAAISRIAPLDRATADELSFLAAPRYVGAAEKSRAGILVVSPDLAGTETAARATIVVDKPHDAVLTLLPKLYAMPQHTPGVHATARLGRGARVGTGVTVEEYAVIGAGATIADGVWIGPHAVVGDGAIVGRDSVLYAHCTIYSGSELGERVRIQSGARIGCDGFGYVFRDGAHQPIPHVGRCVIGDDVDVGANTTIDRGSVDDTVIGAGTKIDNLVQIGHNVRMGKLCLIMAHVGIAGSVHLEDGVIMAGQSGAAGHVTIGARARIAGRGAVISDVPAGETWSGYPARPHRESLRATSALFKLAGIIRKLERLADRHDDR